MTTRARIFIDGEAGTTGLQIAERLAQRDDLELLQLSELERKDSASRRVALNAADIAILCLPDAAAREAVALVENPTTRIIDASTAHRAANGWEYGFPEYNAGQRARLRGATRISNPGCYAIASIAILHPLIAAGLLPATWPVSINAVSGYSGGGKGLIQTFENSAATDAKRHTVYDYALSLEHKHVPEITHWSGLQHAPVFLPAVGNYYKGMLVHVPLALWALPGAPTAQAVYEIYRAHYHNERFVTLADFSAGADLSELDPESLNGSNELRLHVLHHAERGHAVVVGLLDNLGKGASGQAVQTLNILLEREETCGL
jgi:N-acetyl-gamma-glutamyl-phosphate reductase